MGDLDESGTFQRVLDNMDKGQKRLDDSLRQLAALSANPLSRRNFMRRLLRGSRSEKEDEPCTKPKQKQSQELSRKSRNQMRREQICLTGQVA